MDAYSTTWAEATRKFRAAVAGTASRTDQIAVPGLDENPNGDGEKDGEALCIDIAVWEGPETPRAEPSRVLLYTAGQHGVAM